jgi:hypothetical protein
MIDSKIILAQNLLKQKGVDYDHEKIDDTSVVFFLFLPQNPTIENLLQLWTTIDDLDFRTFNGCTTRVDVYEERGVGVIELSVQEKKSSFYGLPPARVTPPTTLQLPAPVEVSKDPSKDYLISDYEYNQSLQQLTRSIMSGDELADIEEYIQMSYYDYEGPFYTFADLQDSIYFDIIEPIEKSLKISPKPGEPPKHPNTIKITISKFSGEVFLITEVQNFDKGSKRKHFKCRGLIQLEILLNSIGFYK